MCSGDVGKGQAYWGVINVGVSEGNLTEDQLETFKTALRTYLASDENGLPGGLTGVLANGIIKVDDPEDGASISLFKRNP